ncbi:MAG: indolepyruvate ferredoxin oxidoreductase family protein, partial [Candidatus Puniceispirillaceae bacterium]
MDGSQDNSKEIADRLAGDRLNAVSLADKYNLDTDVVFVNGTQALVRMCLMQSEIDRQHGINSAGYVTGYRGSPLGGIDLQFAQASAPLTDSQIVFTPALNEDLAATAVWGTQQAALHGENTHDGVFAIWYGKGPGVDRTGDVFRHANLAGTDPKGGVLALMGDDHTGESSTVCHQSEYAMMDVMIPVLNPVNLEEMVQFGLHGWAMSRYSGLWVGLKCVKDNIESSSSARLSLEQFSSKLPNDVDLPEGGLNIRRNDHRHSQEERLHKHKIAAAHGYVRANQIDRVIYSGGKKARFGIVATGKAYMDVLQALSDLGISGAQADKMGLALYKVGMSWPVEPSGLTAFARSLDRLFVVEEKRGLMEEQIKSILYNLPARPLI